MRGKDEHTQDGQIFEFGVAHTPMNKDGMKRTNMLKEGRTKEPRYVSRSMYVSWGGLGVGEIRLEKVLVLTRIKTPNEVY